MGFNKINCNITDLGRNNREPDYGMGSSIHIKNGFEEGILRR